MYSFLRSMSHPESRRRPRPITLQCSSTARIALVAVLFLSTRIASGFFVHHPSQKNVVALAGRPTQTTWKTSLSKAGKSTGFETRLYFANSTSELALSLSETAHTTSRRTSPKENLSAVTTDHKSFKVYCDMDGVLVDFEKGVYNLLQTGTSNIDKPTMWKNIARIPHWFEKLEWKKDGRRLWQAIKHLQPDILTGVPNIQTSCVDKYNWCKRELQLQDAHHVDMAADGRICAHESINGNKPRDDTTNVITCWSTNKYRECKRGSVLIDDRIDLKDSWEAAGGIFIHHIDTETTLHKLREHGILPEELEGEEWYWEGSWRLWRI
ncbi:hypothetical protein IV203_034834 [Nitzschia inconspicua]|uniref:Uncharacterized protein n=1 Tax=Nitzschia inconspicua TaxID=303405 RepID=A0A9K3LF41_9STRA|nr:hypothetical protein IV203_034834 [Nitzschia inconspicua]